MLANLKSHAVRQFHANQRLLIVVARFVTYCFRIACAITAHHKKKTNRTVGTGKKGIYLICRRTRWNAVFSMHISKLQQRDTKQKENALTRICEEIIANGSYNESPTIETMLFTWKIKTQQTKLQNRNTFFF